MSDRQPDGASPVPGRRPRLLDAGEAWLCASHRPTERGEVVAAFGSACYVRFGHHLLAVCGPVPSGPLHLRCAGADWPSLRADLEPGATIERRHDRVVTAAHELSLSAVTRWRPPPVDGQRLAAAGALADGVAWHHELARRSGIAADDLDAAARSLAADDLEAVATRLGGLGPGLTPAGDDFLAGVLVADSALRPERPARRAAAAAAARTTALSDAFLAWAARGRTIAPLHQLLGALAAGRAPAAGEAVVRLGGVGATSGAAMGLGALLRVRASAPVS